MHLNYCKIHLPNKVLMGITESIKLKNLKEVKST